MPFIVPIIAGAFTAAAIGQAIVGVALSVGLSALARRLAPKPRELQQSGAGMRLSLRIDPNAEREIVVGKAATAGTLAFWNLYGPNGNDSLQLVFVLADHECTSLERVWVDGKLVTLGTDLGPGHSVAEYPNMAIKFHSGAWSQDADDELITHAGDKWSTNNRGRGVCYIRVSMQYDEDLYPTGQPRFLFEIKGAKLYDWRKDSTNGGSGAHRWSDQSTHEWSENPVLVEYNWRRGFWVNGNRLAGMATSVDALPVAAWTAAANACDESVALKAGGTETRYRCAGVIAVNQDNKSVLSDLVTAFAGFEIDTGGQIVPRAGVAQTSVLDITDDDLVSDGDVEITPRLPRSDLTNAVFGTYHDPNQVYEAIALPPRISPDDEDVDGGVHLPEHYALDMVTSQSQGQRCLEIFRRRERWQRRVKMKLRSRFCVLEAGDWVTWDSARYGITDGVFEVISASLASDLTVTVSLREVSSSIYSWTAATDELDPAAPGEVSSGGSTFTTIAGFAVAPVLIEGGTSSSRPGLHATWTAITDTTVDAVEIEYRRQGDTVALTVRTELQDAGQYTWVSGVQGGVIYEARARPITRPERAVSWTGWATTAGDTDPQTVEVAALSLEVPEGAISTINLDAQARFELALSTAVDDTLGSAGHDIRLAMEQISSAGHNALRALIGQDQAKTQIKTEQRIREDADNALAQQITLVQAALGTSNANIVNEQTARASGDSALATSLTAVSTTVDGHTATITTLSESVDGLSASWGVAIDINGNVIGLVRLDGGASGSTFDVVANVFRVAQPGVTGGDPVAVFQISNVSGTPRLTLNGDMIADGGIAARTLSVVSLSAISADLGEITAGRMESTDGNFVIDLDNKLIEITV